MMLKYTELDGTKSTELNPTRNVGPELKIRGTRTTNINSFCLINHYLLDDRLCFVLFFYVSVLFSYVPSCKKKSHRSLKLTLSSPPLSLHRRRRAAGGGDLRSLSRSSTAPGQHGSVLLQRQDSPTAAGCSGGGDLAVMAAGVGAGSMPILGAVFSRRRASMTATGRCGDGELGVVAAGAGATREGADPGRGAFL
jgi:hypothetical protein